MVVAGVQTLVPPVGFARKVARFRPSRRGVEAVAQSKLTIKSPLVSRLAQTPSWPSMYWPSESADTSVGFPVRGANPWIALTVTFNETVLRWVCAPAALVRMIEQASNRISVALRMDLRVEWSVVVIRKPFMMKLLLVRQLLKMDLLNRRNSNRRAVKSFQKSSVGSFDRI